MSTALDATLAVGSGLRVVDGSAEETGDGATPTGTSTAYISHAANTLTSKMRSAPGPDTREGIRHGDRRVELSPKVQETGDATRAERTLVEEGGQLGHVRRVAVDRVAEHDIVDLFIDDLLDRVQHL